MAGLSLYQIEDVKLRAEAVGVPVDLPLVKARKNEVLHQEYQEVLEIVEPEGGFEPIGDYDYVKRAFHRLVARIRRGAVTKLPKGISLLGPAGTGKTELPKPWPRKPASPVSVSTWGAPWGNMWGRARANWHGRSWG
jgi:hypothetical protein